MIEPIRRVSAARPGQVHPVPPLPALKRVERDERRGEEEDPPARRTPRGARRRPLAPADGHVDVEA